MEAFPAPFPLGYRKRYARRSADKLRGTSMLAHEKVANAESELFRYLIRNYAHLLNESDQRAIHALRMFERPDMNGMWSRVKDAKAYGDPRIHEAVEFPARFLHRVCNALLKEHGDVIVIARCQQCNALLRSPRAGRCMACGREQRAL